MPAISSRDCLLVVMLASVGCSGGDRPHVARSEQLGSEGRNNPEGTNAAIDSNVQVLESAAIMSAAKSSRDSGSTHPPASGKDRALEYDTASRTVRFELIGGPSGFEFNGFGNGEATLTLPSKADVNMTFINKDGTPHSAEVISGEGPLPSAGITSALPRAYTKDLLQGLAQEESDTMRFTVPERGTYRIICGVPGHALSGMWIWLKATPEAKAPSFGATK